MKLYYHRNKNGIPNFGDDLNPWLWSRLIAEELDDNSSTMFLGIGTLLNDRLPPARARVVFGTGCGIGGPPSVSPSWTFYAVRGPLSAKALGLDPEYAVTDPAILVSHLVPPANSPKRFSFSYMPHYRNACETWQRACERIGFGYIDPRRPIEEVLQATQSTKVLLAEAMHGAIIADTLRVPWIPIRSGDKILRFKWEDWCFSMEVPYEPRTTLALWEGTSVKERARTAIKGLLASVQLLRASRSIATLSSDAVFMRNRGRFDQLLDRFRTDVRARKFERWIEGPTGLVLESPNAIATVHTRATIQEN
jgi:succinoglycan biosynthesis protein ExoV